MCADLILHVVDASEPAIDEHVATTCELLRELELLGLPRVVVLNKCDLLPPGQGEHLAARYEGAAVCATDPSTFGRLLQRIEAQLPVPALREASDEANAELTSPTA